MGIGSSAFIKIGKLKTLQISFPLTYFNKSFFFFKQKNSHPTSGMGEFYLLKLIFSA